MAGVGKEGDKVEQLIMKLDSAEGLIKLNNDNTVVNASKDRLRVKKRRDEIEALQKDFEDNCKADPEVMHQVGRFTQSYSLGVV